MRWSVGKRFGLLGWQLQASADRPCSGEVGDEGKDPHLSTTERAQQGVDLIDPFDQLRPTEPVLAGEGVDGVLWAWPGAGRFFFFDLASLAAGSIGVPAPVAGHLLGRLGDVIDDAGDELQHIPADGSGSRPRTAGGPSRVAHLCEYFSRRRPQARRSAKGRNCRA